MLKYRITVISLLVLAVSACTPSFTKITTSTRSFSPEGGRADFINVALRALGMKRADLGYRKDFVPSDPFRLPLVDELLKHPLKVVPHLRNSGKRLAGSSPLAVYHFMLSQISAVPSPATGGITPLTREDEAVMREIRNLERGGSLPPGTAKAIGILVAGREKAAVELLKAFIKLRPRELDFLKDKSEKLLAEGEELTEEEYRELVEISAKVDRNRIFKAGQYALEAQLKATELLKQIKVPRRRFSRSWKTSKGIISISGPEDNIHRVAASIRVDFGGNDQYMFDKEGEFSAPIGPPELTDYVTNLLARVSITVDLGGDDRYIGQTRPSFGAGIFGISTLLDVSGDDIYIGGDYSLGAGLFGVGVIIDQGGMDRYAGRNFTQGAAFMGLGLLIDTEGEDRYEAGGNAQGYGLTGGVGLLLDQGGSDSYFSGARRRDHREEGQYFQSFAQGFGMGLRPIGSGGVGLLVDANGNDTYVADYFGQGSSYWYAFGGLVDLKGHDKYIARRYCQGAATHLTVGALVDLEGDDRYMAWGVAQGAGHDLGIGILFDGAGNDDYTAQWLAQGGGNANGIGILADAAGDDKYIAPGDRTQGDSEPMREYPSIGIFIDADGDDSYAGRGKNNDVWSGKGVGVGVDGTGRILWEEEATGVSLAW